MARTKSDVNKAAEIRALLETDLNLSAREVIDNLAARGIQARAQDVYNVRSGMKSNGTKGKSGRKTSTNGHPPAATTKAANSSAFQIVIKVTNLANEVGGMKNLKQLVDAMAT